jgi:hypothetical protein
MVRFQIQFGKRRGGGFGVGLLPRYSIFDWRPSTTDEGGLLFRPSLRTVWRRLALTLIAAILLGMMWWSHGFPWKQEPPAAPAPANQAELDAAARELQADFERNMTPEQRRQFQQRLDRAQLERERRLAGQRAQLDWMDRAGRAVHWTVFEALLVLGLLPLLLAAWERVDLRNGPEGELIIRRRRFLTSERAWPRGSFGGIMCSAAERIHRTRRYETHEGWFWVVRLLPRHEHGGLAAPQHLDDPVVEFDVGRQPDRPFSEHKPPKRVRTFLKHLCRMTELDPASVQFGLVPEPVYQPRGFWQRWPRVRKQTVTYTSAPVVESVEYRSLDEMPPEMRKKVQRMMKQGIPSEGIAQESVRITIRDADGNERTYTSLDEMPPDVRESYEKVRHRMRRRRSREG